MLTHLSEKQNRAAQRCKLYVALYSLVYLYKDEAKKKLTKKKKVTKKKERVEKGGKGWKKWLPNPS